MGGLFRPVPKLKLRRNRLELPDGDFLDLDFLETPSSNGKTDEPLVVILHGLEGSSGARYVRSLAGAVQSRGWSAAAVNMRMCSGEPNRLIETYHSGKSEDLDFVVRYLREVAGYERLYLVGFSIGGNIVLKWLGESGGRASEKIRQAAAVSVPYDLVKSVELMDRGFNREVYTRSLLKGLKAKVALKAGRFPGAVHYDRVKRSGTFREFDGEVTAPLNGFKGEMDYWSQSSCKRLLGSIRVPTLLIHAEDDPFFPGPGLPLELIRHSPYLKLVLASHGGHLGFVAGSWPWKQEPWLEQRIMDFFGKA
jgi:hypothetical protein